MVAPKKIIVLLFSHIFLTVSAHEHQPTFGWMTLFEGLSGRGVGQQFGEEFKRGCMLLQQGYMQGTKMEFSFTPATKQTIDTFNSKLATLENMQIAVHPTTLKSTSRIIKQAGLTVGGTSLIVSSAYIFSKLAHRCLNAEHTPPMATNCAIGACGIATLTAGFYLITRGDTLVISHQKTLDDPEID